MVAIPIIASLFFTFSHPKHSVAPKIHKIKVTAVAATATAPAPTPQPPQNPTPQIVADNVKSFLMTAINDYRKSQGLSEVKTDSNTCDFAKTRAREISQNFNHDGFNNRIQNHTLPYPSYHTITENIAMNPNYKNVVAGWISSAGHAANMRADTPFVCVENAENYYVYEGWKP